MENIINELFYNEVCQDYLKLNSGWIKEVGKMSIEFKNSLCEKKKDLFDTYSEALFNVSAENELATFNYGFKLGFCLVLDALK